MLEFRNPILEDKLWAGKILKSSSFYGCEYTFGNIMMWHEVYKNKIARFEDFLVTCSQGEQLMFAFPAGDGDLKKIISEMENYAASFGQKLKIFGVTEKSIDTLEKLFPGKFTFTMHRGSCDYIYLTEKLAQLKGKKFHGKRNHIAAFEKAFPQWKYHEIDKSNIDLCIDMNRRWEKENLERNPRDLSNEQKAISIAFENFFDLDLVGGFITANDSVVAYTIGEEINSDVFCTHIEKAFGDVRGAYPIINREFAKNTISSYKYVNREEDLGEEGLRKAKLSYQPDILLEKYTAEVQ